MITTTPELCDFCGLAAHHGACAELLAYTERMKARMVAPAHTCTTCGAVMQPAGKRAWICPNQKDQGNGIAVAARQAAQKTAVSRVVIDGMPIPF